MINGSALCAALAATERDWPGWPDCSQTVQIPDSGRMRIAPATCAVAPRSSDSVCCHSFRRRPI